MSYPNETLDNPSSPSIEDVPSLIRELYGIVRRLENLFPGRHFTPDGHLIGSIGEVLANHYYGIELTAASTAGHDGNRNGRQVEIKTTQRDRVALSSCPQHLIVFKIHPTGSFEECFNGPGNLAWAEVEKRKATKNGQHQISLTRLRELMREEVSDEEKIEPINPLP